MIEFQNLNFAYSRKQTLFQGINLSMQAGNIYGLLGKNGVGKTTMLKLISGLLFPKAGECTVIGYCPQERKVGFLAQLFYVPDEIVLPAMKLNDNVRVNKVF